MAIKYDRINERIDEPLVDPAMEYLQEIEWSLGNGQCPQCYGQDPGRWVTGPEVGHLRGCELAAALLDLGDPVAYLQPPREPRTELEQAQVEAHQKMAKDFGRRFDETVCRVLTA